MLWAIVIVMAVCGFFLMLGIVVSKLFSGLSFAAKTIESADNEMPQVTYRYGDNSFDDTVVTRSSITTRSMCDDLDLRNPW